MQSLRHYLIIWADKRQVVHHWRNARGAIESEIITSGQIILDPPGVTITVDEIYAE